MGETTCLQFLVEVCALQVLSSLNIIIKDQRWIDFICNVSGQKYVNMKQ